MSDAEDRAELDAIRASVLKRKHDQNARRLKKGAAPMHPELLRKPTPKRKRASKAAQPPAPETGCEEETALSFDEWKNCGWCVKKGESYHHLDINGIPQFLRTQVRKHNPAWDSFRRRNYKKS